MSETKVVTGEVRFSYVHVFEPSAAAEGQAEKYSVSIIIDKKDKKTLKKIEDAIQAAAEAGKDKFGGKVPKALKTPLRDGDDERPEDEAYAGCMFLSANSNRKPGLVDENLDPIMDREDFYSGCYGRASILFYPFSVSGNKGVAAGLNNIQKLKDGAPLGGVITSAEDDFGDDLM
jgi:hypothetical protein